MNMLKTVIILFLAWSWGNCCPREPSPYHSSVAKRVGDNGYAIKVENDPKKYVPGEVYTGM